MLVEKQSPPPPPPPDEENIEDEWSNILIQTNSAVESFSDAREIGVRPRRQLGAEKRQQQQQEAGVENGGAAKKDVFHTHTHHHYHHPQSMRFSINNILLPFLRFFLCFEISL